MELAPQLEELARRSPKTVIRVIDIGNWGSPVAQQHGLNSIPHLVLFEDGKQVAAGTEAVWRRLQQ